MGCLFDLNCWLKRLYRQGPNFYKYLRSLEASMRFSGEILEKYQNYHLRRMIWHCYFNVPYYRDLFRREGLQPEDVASKCDLNKLPFLDKKTVNDNYDKLISKGHQNFLCHVGSTSGSTGSPARFLRDYNAINFENAAVWRHWRAPGIVDRNESRCAVILSFRPARKSHRSGSITPPIKSF